MIRAGVAIGLAIFIAGEAWAQAPADLPSFEVASIKPSAPPTGAIRIGPGGGPGSSDPGRINFQFASLKMLLQRAYEVKPYQISGPSWLDTERFDVIAIVPPGATKEQIPLMLQALLAERFKLTLHREKKELPIYALVVGKNGPKLKESPPETDAKGADGPPPGAMPPPPPPLPGGPMAGPGRGGPPMGKDGFPVLPPGRRGTMIMMSPGKSRMAANRMSTTGIADFLSGQFDRPVLDMTELKGVYDFTMEWSMEGLRPMGPMGGGFFPPGGGGGEAGAPAPDGQAVPSIFTAVQEQLGLKLEPRKGPVDLLVIDHMEKAPTEN